MTKRKNFENWTRVLRRANNEEKKFRKLELMSASFLEGPDQNDSFRRLLVQSSATNLNRTDTFGWTFLTHVLWNADAGEKAITTLRCMLGPDVLAEDHSRLRLDKRISMPIVDAPASPMDVVKILQKKLSRYSSRQESIKIAEGLLQDALHRVASYPRRLLQILKEVLFYCLPITTLYPIIVDCIVWP